MFLNHKSLSLFLIICFCISCKSRKLAKDARIEQNTAATALEILHAHNIEYNWFSAKAKLKYSDPYDSESGTAFIRIRKDSVIWMTLKKFSVEGFRIAMNPDSIVVINRLDKTYSVSYWNELSERYETELTYEKLEKSIIGNVALPQDTSALKVQSDSTAYKFSFLEENYTHKYVIPLFLNTISDYTIIDSRGRKVNLYFDDCRKEDDFCYFREYSIPLSNDEQLFLRLEISELEIDIPKNTPFGIPSRYTRL